MIDLIAISAGCCCQGCRRVVAVVVNILIYFDMLHTLHMCTFTHAMYILIP